MVELTDKEKEVLKALAKKGTQTTARLVLQLAESQASLKQVLDKLAQEGLVSDEELKDSKKTRSVSITRQGVRTLQRS